MWLKPVYIDIVHCTSLYLLDLLSFPLYYVPFHILSSILSTSLSFGGFRSLHPTTTFSVDSFLLIYFLFLHIFILKSAHHLFSLCDHHLNILLCNSHYSLGLITFIQSCTFLKFSLLVLTMQISLSSSLPLLSYFYISSRQTQF